MSLKRDEKSPQPEATARILSLVNGDVNITSDLTAHHFLRKKGKRVQGLVSCHLAPPHLRVRCDTTSVAQLRSRGVRASYVVIINKQPNELRILVARVCEPRQESMVELNPRVKLRYLEFQWAFA